MNPLKRLFGFGNKNKNNDANVINVIDENFQLEVIRRSYKTPVMVDFWASWCGPCRMLGPVLEKLADETNSGFLLAKLDTEESQRTAAQYRISSIPAIKVFRNGQIVGEFTGMMPAANIRKFMDKIIAAPPPPPRLKMPAKPEQRIKQAQQHLRKGRGFEAFMMLNDFPHGKLFERAQKLLPLAKFLCDMEDGDWPSGNEQLDNMYITAADALKSGDPKTAVAEFIAVIKEGSVAKTASLEVLSALFTLLGANHKVTKTYAAEITAL